MSDRLRVLAAVFFLEEELSVRLCKRIIFVAQDAC
jgi:hypothetical protein